GRVTPPCPIAGPGLCGGCDFQHADLPTQRELKRRVVAEQLERLAGIDWAGEVEPVGAEDGLGWRTRMRYHARTDERPHPDGGRLDAHRPGGDRPEEDRPESDRPDGTRFGLRAHRSDRVVGLPADGCRIAVAPLRLPPAAPAAELLGVAAAERVVWAPPGDRADDQPLGTVRERVRGREFAVAVDGFWQAHAAAPEVLTGAVLDGLLPEPGETAFDLYCGVGLFAAALYDRGCRVIGVEGERTAVRLARANLADAGSRARVVGGSVDRVLNRPRQRGGLPAEADLVGLDPPRAGAGRKVITALARRRPRAVAYVACDPAALARDLGYLATEGYRLTSLRAFDLFPMTHHVECVAVLHRH
ncbi:MAG TPA: hypothetical protein VK020_05200, partial [Microlunatus sp.]|nr:hypothetical protein [Microlunatus sp.]